MDPEIKKSWLFALRSDGFPQGRAHLKHYRDGKAYYCCLGVLEEVLGSEPRWITDGRVCFRGSAKMCSASVLRKAGLLPSEASGLAGMNDSGSNFAQIADYIEQYL